MPFFRFCFQLLPVTLLALLAGCASVSVGNVNPKGNGPKKLPSKIYVREFIAPYDNFRVDRSDADLLAFVKKERHELAGDLVQQLSKYIAPAQILDEKSPLPKGNYWLVQGTYERVNQGSRLLRAGIGFGAGGTKMETRVQFLSLNAKKPEQFLSLVTTGGSGLAPGAWAAFTPAFAFYWPGAIMNAGGASLSGLSVDRNRTAREIAAALSEYSFQHGLIPKKRARRPKKLGEIPPLQRPDFIVPKTST